MDTKEQYEWCISRAAQIRLYALSLGRGTYGAVTAEQEEITHEINKLSLDLIDRMVRIASKETYFLDRTTNTPTFTRVRK